MFNNLIESNSHTGEFKRRGSFVLFTSATYVLFFVVAGVMSIYAYDARLDYQNTEIITMLNPLDLPAAPVSVTHNAPPPPGDTNRSNQVIRANDFVSINHPEKVPESASARPNTGLPVPDSGTYSRGDHDSGPALPDGGSAPGNGGGTGNNSAVALAVEVGTPPPPAPTPTPKRIITSPRVLNGLALSLPKPPYPPIAKQAGVQGPVNVQVLIDESGRVVSAKPISGSPLLIRAAQQAAFQARFSPTMLDEQAVKVSGVIVYNFVLQ